MLKTRMMKKIMLALLVFTYAFLCACGTKGPLYIPEQRYPEGVPKAKPAQPAVLDSTPSKPN